MVTFRIQFHDSIFADFIRARGTHTNEQWRDWCAAGTVISESRSTTVTRHRVEHPGASLDVHVKHFRHAGGRGRSIWPRDKAEIEARNTEHIRRYSPFDAPHVLATASNRKRTRLTDSWLVTRTIPDALSLEKWFPGSSDRARSAALSRLATGLAQMHAAGFVHIDLQARNILLRESDGGPNQIFLIDSTRGGLRADPIRQAHGRLRDLSALYKSLRPHLRATNALRHYRAYRGKAHLDDIDRLLLRTILADRALKDNDAAP